MKEPPKATIAGDRFSGLYEQLFSETFFAFDEDEPYFQEKLLQAIWNEQLVHQELVTEQGDPVQVIHPGVWNVEAGPDFHHAVVQIAGKTLRGPVELHLRPEGWHQHGHQHNPEYQDVILHVVWQNPAGHTDYPLGIPLLRLAGQLSRPLPQIMDEIELSAYPYARQVQPVEAARHLAELSDPFLRDLFQSYGIARILQKAQALSQSIQQQGLEPAVYALFLDILGYKNNREAFAKVAVALPLDHLAGADLDTALALFFGTAGLLPDPTQVAILPRHQERVRRMWTCWWSRRSAHQPIHWNRHRLRPYNVPERRLAAAAVVLEQNNFALGKALVESFTRLENPVDCLKAIRQIFAPPELDDWAAFLSFEKDLAHGATLLGASRLNDLVVNLAAPLMFAWCLLENRPDLCHRGKKLLSAMPRLQGNRLLKEAASQFFVPPSRAATIITNACAQQGLLKLYGDWNRAS